MRNNKYVQCFTLQTQFRIECDDDSVGTMNVDIASNLKFNFSIPARFWNPIYSC